MTEELKDAMPPVEAPAPSKSPEELIAESKERTAIYEGSGVAQKGYETISHYANNEQFWERIPPPETRDTTTEHARHTWALQEQKKVLESGGKLLISRGEIRHQALLPDDYGYKVPEMRYEFKGTGFSAELALDENGDPTRTIVYELPSDSHQPRRIELFTRDGNLEAQSGTPEFDTLEKELLIEIGKGLRPAPKELTEQEAIDAATEQALAGAVEDHFGSEAQDIRNLPETPEESGS